MTVPYPPMKCRLCTTWGSSPLMNPFLCLSLFSLFILLQNLLTAQEPIRTWTSSDGRGSVASTSRGSTVQHLPRCQGMGTGEDHGRSNGQSNAHKFERLKIQVDTMTEYGYPAGALQLLHDSSKAESIILKTI